MPEAQIFIARNGQTHGPYSLDLVKKYLATGQLLENDFALLEGKNEWQSLQQLLESISRKTQKEIVTKNPDHPTAKSSSASIPKDFNTKEKKGYKRKSSKIEGKGKKILLISGVVAVLSLVGYFSFSLILQDANTVADPNKPDFTNSHAVNLDPKTVGPFLSNHCTECHGPDKQNGDIRLDNLSLSIADGDIALHWQDVLDVINLGEMPPPDVKQPTSNELQSIIRHLTLALDTSKKRLSENGGNVALRRINQREYIYSIKKLTGMHYFGKRIGSGILPKQDTPLANYWLTLCQQSGIQMDRFSHSTGTVSEIVQS